MKMLEKTLLINKKRNSNEKKSIEFHRCELERTIIK